MDLVNEVLVVSDSANKTTNCSIYDLKSGNLISTFKEGNSVQNGLTFIGLDFLISAFKDQRALKLWTLSLNYQEDCKMIPPERVSALAASNCGNYCVGAIESNISVWEVASGNLLISIKHHQQPVTCLRFSSDGSYIISGGKDNAVLVWSLSEVVAVKDSDCLTPRFAWRGHDAGVTDIYVGKLGIYSRVVTASRDMTCRIYELETGSLLTTVRVNYGITAVTMDDAEYFLVLGSAEGDIYRINLFSVNAAEVHYNNSEKKFAFLGHSNEITSLSISSTGKYLASGSEDKDCRVWDMSNFSCIRKIPCAGPVTNAFISLLPPGLKNEARYNPRLCIFPFNFVQLGNRGAVSTRTQLKKLSLLHVGSPDEYFDSRILNSSSESLEAMLRDNLSVEELKHINFSMYSEALRDIFNIADETPEEETQEESD